MKWLVFGAALASAAPAIGADLPVRGALASCKADSRAYLRDNGGLRARGEIDEPDLNAIATSATGIKVRLDGIAVIAPGSQSVVILVSPGTCTLVKPGLLRCKDPDPHGGRHPRAEAEFRTIRLRPSALTFSARQRGATGDQQCQNGPVTMALEYGDEGNPTRHTVTMTDCRGTNARSRCIAP